MRYSLTPYVLLSFLCDTPKASKTKWSANEAYACDKSELDDSLVENLLIRMSITNLSQKYFSHLSEGEKQIALIARALIIKPEILILDEPISNLDLKSKFYVIDQINELTKLNSQIFCITHSY